MLKAKPLCYLLGDPFFGHLPDQIPSCKIFQLSIRTTPRRSHLLDPLLLIPYFHSASETTQRLDHLLPAARSFSVDPLFLVPLAGQSTGSGGCSFLLADPVFLIPFRATPLVPILRLCVRRPHGHIGVLRWTHFYSFRLIDEEPFLQDFVPGRLTGLRDIGIQEALQKGGFVFRLVWPSRSGRCSGSEESRPI